jgi:hypothetical protein
MNPRSIRQETSDVSQIQDGHVLGNVELENPYFFCVTEGWWDEMLVQWFDMPERRSHPKRKAAALPLGRATCCRC